MANVNVVNLRSADLNLLPILRSLLNQGSVTAAARQLNLSQPATSHALGRLRHLLGDPLLVKVGRTMRLTPRAEQLRPLLDCTCSAIEALLLAPAFEPEHAVRNFTIGTPDYMALLLGPKLMAIIKDQAPGVTARFVDIGPDIRDRIASGQIDLAIITRIESINRGLCVRSGYKDTMVGVVSSRHPLATDPPQTIEILDRWPRIGIGTGQAAPPGHAVIDIMRASDTPLTLSASHLLVLPLLAAQTDGVAIVPKALADQAAHMVSIACFALPGPNIPLDICLTWSPLLDSDPAHQWFRAAVDSAMQLHFTS